MRRLIHLNTKLTATVFVSVLLLFCSIVGFTSHTSDNAQSAKASCTSACHSHGQSTALNNLTKEENDDDKEPTPPPFAWYEVPVNLSLLYVMPVFAVLWFMSNKQKLLLTTQLRF